MTEIELFEISLVTFPANARARVTAVKAGGIASPHGFERAMRGLGFSRRQARILVARGFRALAEDAAAGRHGAAEPVGDAGRHLIASIERAERALAARR